MTPISISGIIPPITTPFDAEDRIDEAALRTDVRYLVETAGVHGLAVGGSAGDPRLLADLLLLVDDRSAILSAVDALLYPSFALGAHGAIAAILTAAPTLCVRLWEAVRAGDHATALELHRKLLPIWNALNADNLPANVKYAMELQGRPAGEVRAPMPKTTSAQAAAIRTALESAGLLGPAN